MKHLRFLLDHWFLLTLIVLTGLMLPLMDTVIVSFVFPILQGLGGGATMAIPFPFNHIAALFTTMGLAERLRIIAAIMVGATIIKGIVSYFNSASSFKLQAVSYKHFRMLFIRQLMRIGMRYFNSQRYADLQTFSSVHIINIVALIGKLSTCLTQALNGCLLVAVLFLLSWKLMLCSCILVIFASFVLRRLAHAAEFAGKTYTRACKFVNGILFDAVRGVKTIQLFNREKDEVNHLEEAADEFNTTFYKVGKVRSAVQPIYEAVGIASIAAIIVIMSFMQSKMGSVGVGVLAVFVVMFQRISSAMMQFNKNRVEIMADKSFYQEFFNFLDVKNKHVLKNGKIRFKGFEKAIEWKNVNFKYRTEKNEMVLRNISLTIPKRHKIGIVGPSGAGKSTFIELLFRFYDPQSGQIMVDGHDLKDLDISDWRHCVGMVSQDVFLFNESVRHNIAYAKPDATKAEIEQAAKKAYAHDFIIRDLPQGYDTLLGERGVLLSGGQRQRIAIARAIIMEPDILVFDEATSALDTGSERIVQRALDEVGKDRTVVTIAHRLSTIFDSDRIFVIDDGKLIEEGTHQELMQVDGLYCRLVKMQNMEEQLHQPEQAMAVTT